MGSAFECDRCEGLYSGEPARFKLREYHERGLTGWTGTETHYSAELCGECAEELYRYAAVLFGAEDSFIPALEEFEGIETLAESEDDDEGGE